MVAVANFTRSQVEPEFLPLQPSTLARGGRDGVFCGNNPINLWDYLGMNSGSYNAILDGTGVIIGRRYDDGGEDFYLEPGNVFSGLIDSYEYGVSTASGSPVAVKFGVRQRDAIDQFFFGGDGRWVDWSNMSTGDTMYLGRLQSEDGIASNYDGNLGYAGAFDANLRGGIPPEALAPTISWDQAIWFFGNGYVDRNSGTPLELLAGGNVAAAAGAKKGATSSGGTFVLTDRKTTANHVATDGKGGLVVVIAPNQPAYYYTNPVINSSIRIHEGVHILDAYNFNSAIANGQPAGRVLATTGSAFETSEIRAYNTQLSYLSAALQNPRSFNLTTGQLSQVQAYQTFVQNAFNTRFPGAPGTTPGP